MRTSRKSPPQTSSHSRHLDRAVVGGNLRGVVKPLEVSRVALSIIGDGNLEGDGILGRVNTEGVPVDLEWLCALDKNRFLHNLKIEYY